MARRKSRTRGRRLRSVAKFAGEDYTVTSRESFTMPILDNIVFLLFAVSTVAVVIDFVVNEKTRGQK